MGAGHEELDFLGDVALVDLVQGQAADLLGVGVGDGGGGGFALVHGHFAFAGNGQVVQVDISGAFHFFHVVLADGQVLQRGGPVVGSVEGDLVAVVVGAGHEELDFLGGVAIVGLVDGQAADLLAVGVHDGNGYFVAFGHFRIAFTGHGEVVQLNGSGAFHFLDVVGADGQIVKNGGPLVGIVQGDFLAEIIGTGHDQLDLGGGVALVLLDENQGAKLVGVGVGDLDGGGFAFVHGHIAFTGHGQVVQVDISGAFSFLHVVGADGQVLQRGGPAVGNVEGDLVAVVVGAGHVQHNRGGLVADVGLEDGQVADLLAVGVGDGDGGGSAFDDFHFIFTGHGQVVQVDIGRAGNFLHGVETDGQVVEGGGPAVGSVQRYGLSGAIGSGHEQLSLGGGVAHVGLVKRQAADLLAVVVGQGHGGNGGVGHGNLAFTGHSHVVAFDVGAAFSLNHIVVAHGQILEGGGPVVCSVQGNGVGIVLGTGNHDLNGSGGVADIGLGNGQVADDLFIFIGEANFLLVADFHSDLAVGQSADGLGKLILLHFGSGFGNGVGAGGSNLDGISPVVVGIEQGGVGVGAVAQGHGNGGPKLLGQTFEGLGHGHLSHLADVDHGGGGSSAFKALGSGVAEAYAYVNGVGGHIALGRAGLGEHEVVTGGDAGEGHLAVSVGGSGHGRPLAFALQSQGELSAGKSLALIVRLGELQGALQTLNLGHGEGAGEQLGNPFALIVGYHVVQGSLGVGGYIGAGNIVAQVVELDLVLVGIAKHTTGHGAILVGGDVGNVVVHAGGQDIPENIAVLIHGDVVVDGAVAVLVGHGHSAEVLNAVAHGVIHLPGLSGELDELNDGVEGIKQTIGAVLGIVGCIGEGGEPLAYGHAGGGSGVGVGPVAEGLIIPYMNGTAIAGLGTKADGIQLGQAVVVDVLDGGSHGAYILSIVQRGFAAAAPGAGNGKVGGAAVAVAHVVSGVAVGQQNGIDMVDALNIIGAGLAVIDQVAGHHQTALDVGAAVGGQVIDGILYRGSVRAGVNPVVRVVLGAAKAHGLSVAAESGHGNHAAAVAFQSHELVDKRTGSFLSSLQSGLCVGVRVVHTVGNVQNQQYGGVGRGGGDLSELLVGLDLQSHFELVLHFGAGNGLGHFDNEVVFSKRAAGVAVAFGIVVHRAALLNDLHVAGSSRCGGQQAKAHDQRHDKSHDPFGGLHLSFPLNVLEWLPSLVKKGRNSPLIVNHSKYTG